MEARVLKSKRGEILTNIAAEGVHELVRRLAKHVVNSSQPSARHDQNDDAQQVILDVEVDGVRCLLMRLPSKTPCQVRPCAPPGSDQPRTRTCPYG
jgi:hypothetical protein